MRAQRGQQRDDLGAAAIEGAPSHDGGGEQLDGGVVVAFRVRELGGHLGHHAEHGPVAAGDRGLCRRLQQDPKTVQIPAIMLTARGYHLEPHDTETSGIRRMLSKPFSPRQLLVTVQEVIDENAKAAA